MLMLTIGLGIWQMERLSWKTALLRSIDRGETLPPEPLPPSPEPFRRYVVTGRFMQVQAHYGAEVRATASGVIMGDQAVGALLRDKEPPVIVDRGWVPSQSTPDPPTGMVTVTGYVRLPEHTSWMGAQNDPAGRRFYALDPEAIAASLGLEHAAPFTLVAIGAPGTLPDPVQALPRPSNDHLSYAITWFSLAASLVAVFLIYCRQAVRQGPAT